MPMRTALLPAFLLLASCVPAPPSAAQTSDLLARMGGDLFGSCGVQAAMRIGGKRVNPPACALPADRSIAIACAVNDSARRQDAGGDDRVPGHRVRKSVCAFTGAGRNRASCAFDLLRQGEAEWRRTRGTFVHRFHADHTDISHSYSTFWIADAACMPDP